MCVGPWLNSVYQAGTLAIVVQRYCCSISHSSLNNGIFPLHFAVAVAGAKLNPIHPPDSPQMQKPFLALFCLAPLGKLISESIMLSEQARLIYCLTSEHLSMHISLLPCTLTLCTLHSPFLPPLWGLYLVFAQYRELELRALVNAP